MKTSYSISIPKPCHEDWSKMTPNEKGRFCQSCSKTVVDFTEMNTGEIQDYIKLNRHQRICGHIKQSQLDTINLKIPETVFNQNLNFHRIFLLALLIAMGTSLFNCSDDEGKKQKINNIEIVETSKKIIDSIAKNCVVKETKSDSITSKEKPPVKPKTKKKELIEGLIIVGDIVETEEVPIHQDSINVKLPKDEVIFGFVDISHPPEFLDTPITITESGKKDYFSKRITEFVSSNFDLGQGDYGLKGKHKIMTQFTIDKNGAIRGIKTRAVYQYLEEEARRVIKLLPKFIPGKQRSENVPVVYTLPITIKFED